ncbi:hypothetical protein JOB18_025978 [Solea senegalensis]|uniref:Uncharacterized protein n=1 Tax=Solea senegalensis TaxID=28829 RepID=A0AAV6T7A2_SOLSE|nr:hypothetical protein JOB18_025978 [Solea senegalensis]
MQQQPSSNSRVYCAGLTELIVQYLKALDPESSVAIYFIHVPRALAKCRIHVTLLSTLAASRLRVGFIFYDSHNQEEPYVVDTMQLAAFVTYKSDVVVLRPCLKKQADKLSPPFLAYVCALN